VRGLYAGSAMALPVGTRNSPLDAGQRAMHESRRLAVTARDAGAAILERDRLNTLERRRAMRRRPGASLSLFYAGVMQKSESV